MQYVLSRLESHGFHRATTADCTTPRPGQPVVAENRPGASGAIGGELAAQREPDGYTLFMGTAAARGTSLYVRRSRYDLLKDFAPISMVGTNPFASAATKRYRQICANLNAHVKERQASSASAPLAGGLQGYLTMALFLARAGLKMEPVLYKAATRDG